MIDSTLKTELVKKQVFFSKLTDEEMDELVELFRECKISAGQTLVQEGDQVDSVYLIASGTATVRVSTSPHNPLDTKQIATLNPGDSIGLNESGFYSLTGLRTATVIANTDMTLLRLSVAAFHGFSLSHTHVTEEMHKHEKQNHNLE